MVRLPMHEVERYTDAMEDMGKSGERFRSGKLSENEAALLDKAFRLGRPRREYCSGKIKLEFRSPFTNGDLFSAMESPEGIADIAVTRNNVKLLDFKELVPGYTFVTPTYVHKKFPLDAKGIAGFWTSLPDERLILVGDMREARTIYMLLHEIGHAVELTHGDAASARKARADFPKYTGSFKRRFKDKRRELATVISNDERRANLHALRIVRSVKAAHDVNLLESFNNFKELRDMMYAALLSYRISRGVALVESDKGYMNGVIDDFRSVFGFVPDDSEQWEFMSKLFDKGKLYGKR